MSEEGLARGQDRDDQQIAQAINDRLLQDGGLAAVQIQVSANEATLTGDVESQEERDRAEAIAAAVAGVRYVINNLCAWDRRGQPAPRAKAEVTPRRRVRRL